MDTPLQSFALANVCARLTLLSGSRGTSRSDTFLHGIFECLGRSKATILRASTAQGDLLTEEHGHINSARKSDTRADPQRPRLHERVGQRSSEERSLSTDHASKGGHESIQVGSAGRASKARPGRLINANIMAAQTAEELLDVVQQEIDSPKFGLVNAVTALHRLAKFLSAPGASQTRRREICKHATVLQLAAGAEENVQFMGGYSLSNIAWACRTLDLGTPEFMNKVIHRFVEILPRMRDKEVNGTLAAFSKCGQLTAQNLDIITPYWLKWLKARGRVSQRCLNGLIWAYVKSELGPGEYDKDLVAELARLAKVSLQSSNSTSRLELCGLTWAFARLEVKDEGLFDMLAVQSCTALVLESKSEPTFQEARDMGSCAWGFGKAVGMLATRPVNSRRIDAYIAYHMQAKPCRVRVFSLLCERLPRVIDLLNPVGFSSLLCGLANARYFDEEAMELLTRKLWSMVPTLKIQAAAVTLWAYSVLKYDVPEVCEALAGRILTLLHQEVLTSQAITMMLNACAALDLGHLPNCNRLINELTRLVAADVTVLRTLQSLVNVAWSLACLNRIDRHLLDEICWQACQHSGCNSVSILNQISMADMAVQVDEVSSRSYQEAGKLQRPSRLTETQLQAVAALKSAARAGWMENVCDARNITGFHWSVAKILKELGGTFMLEYTVDGFSLDIAIVEDKIDIEADGPWHFTRNTQRQLGYSLLKRRLLAQRGWKMVVIEHFVWSQMSFSQKKAHLLRQLEDAGWTGLQDKGAMKQVAL